MGVRDNHTKCEPGTQRWRSGTGIASAGPPFQNLQITLEPAESGQMKGNSGYSTHVHMYPLRTAGKGTFEWGAKIARIWVHK